MKSENDLTVKSAGFDIKKTDIPEKLEFVEGGDKPVLNLFPIKETKEFIRFFVLFFLACKYTLEDGKITVTDALNFYEPAKALPAAISGMSIIPAELTDQVTDEEINEIVGMLIDMGILQGKAKDLAVDIIPIAVQLKNIYFKHFVN